jgi:hypothetical protein
LLLGDVNSPVGALQVNLPHSWDTFENAAKEFNNPFGSRLNRDIVYSTEGKKLTEFYERNIFEILK